MRKLRVLVAGVLLALPLAATSAAPAQACTSQIEPDGCALVNRACEKLFGGTCLG
jgi:hypothetical protein